MEQQILKILNYVKNNGRLMLGAIITGIVLFALFGLDVEDPGICSEQGKLGICYSVPEELCQKTWANFEKSCRDEAPKMLGREVRKSELIGPIVNRCQHMKYDKIFYYTRKTNSSPNCAAIYEDADAMKKDLGLD